MRIAVDAMGGDFAPREIVAGAVRAAGSLTGLTRIILVGDRDVVARELASHTGVSDRIEVRHASEVVSMDDSPAQAVRRKRDSSINRAVELVKQGEADAVVSAGNTGGIVVAATLKLRTLAGVRRPAIAAVLPTKGRPCVLVDAGANTDCEPAMLVQFAVMGNVYSRTILGRERPVVRLISTGGEEIKGNAATREAYRLMEKAPVDFRGNVEGHDLFDGDTDVAVCDGFVGNAVLKTTESVAKMMGAWMKRHFTSNLVRRCGVLMLSGAVRELRAKMDPDGYGGAPLLGVNGICIKTHGASRSTAVFHAIRVATESVHHHLNAQISEDIAKVGAEA